MDTKEYKLFHESFMRNHNGTTLLESYAVFTIIPFSLLLAVTFSCLPVRNYACFLIFQTVILVLPITLCATLLSDYIFHILSFITTIFILTVLNSGINYHQRQNLSIEKATYITNYRAAVNFLTALCILAVDFNSFPRRFAKTENYGTGVMDLGVGLFLCSNGIVYKTSSSTKKLSRTFKTILPLFLLGLTRLISIKSTDYHEHITEYGIHWNFFFTLASCKIIIYVFQFMKLSPINLGVICSGVHYIFLKMGLQDWVLSDLPRNDYLTANREGLSSLLGYVSLYFFSVEIGILIFKTKNKYDLLKKMFLLSIILWVAVNMLNNVQPCSRKLVNITYIIWVLAYTLTMLWNFLLIELITFTLTCKSSSVFLFECINSHGLVFFLCSNILTGAVNICLQTLLINSNASFFILLLYMLTLCILVQFYHVYKNQIIKLVI